MKKFLHKKLKFYNVKVSRSTVCMYVCVHYMEGAIYVLPTECYVFVCMCPAWRVVCTVVSRKYTPAYCNLSLSTKRRGGAYMWDATISLTIPPSLPGIKSLLVGGGDQAWGIAERERKDADNASGRLKSFSVEERGSRALRKVAGVSIVDAGGPCSLYTLQQ